MMRNAAKNFSILVTSLGVLHNCFDDFIWLFEQKLFSDLYLPKFLNFQQNYSFHVMIIIVKIYTTDNRVVTE